MLDMRVASRILGGVTALFIAVAVGAISYAEEPPNLAGSSVPTPGPVVFVFEISRTSESLSLFNVLPPPLPLSNVLQVKAEQTASAPAVPNKTTHTAPPTPSKAKLAWAQRTATRTEDMPTSTPHSKPASAIFRTAWVPPPEFSSPPPREYPDMVILTNGSKLPCQVLSQTETALRLELSNGVIVQMPKQRIAQINGKAPSR